MAVSIIRNWWQHYWLHIVLRKRDSDSWILCSVLFINVPLMCAKLRNFYSLKIIIIRRILGNNRKTFWELQNRIFGKILSIVASSLSVFTTCSRVHCGHKTLWVEGVCSLLCTWQLCHNYCCWGMWCGRGFAALQAVFHVITISGCCFWSSDLNPLPRG